VTHVDLFSGIGGFAFGFEETGRIHTQAFVENNPFCQEVLRKHWPGIPIAEDITNTSFRSITADIMSGGFPCQDVSIARGRWGTGDSILDQRSGLWWHFRRAIEEAQPKWVVIENVKALLYKGMGIILSQLADLGYDAEWRIIRACDVGLPHFRERLWVIAHRNSLGLQGSSPFPLQGLQVFPWGENGRAAQALAWRWHNSPPELLRSRNGLPRYVDRVKAIGNSIVPQIAYVIGEAILLAEEQNER
jgi:DNA (cytosine-5)-methyltransferase 1